MNYIDSFNGYDVYEATRGECAAAGYAFPTFAAFLGEDIKLGREECSMEDLDDLFHWCMRN